MIAVVAFVLAGSVLAAALFSAGGLGSVAAGVVVAINVAVVVAAVRARSRPPWVERLTLIAPGLEWARGQASGRWYVVQRDRFADDVLPHAWQHVAVNRLEADRNVAP